MKEKIHPKYQVATVTCACGNSWTTRSTRPQLRTDLCSQCHPFFTGEQRIVDTAGQVDRFLRRMNRQNERAEQQAAAAAEAARRQAELRQQQQRRPRRASPPPQTLESLLENTGAATEESNT